MKTFIVITLFFSLVFSQTSIDELLKLPKLYSHFLEHRQVNQKMSFADFLKLHYTHGDLKDKDYDKDCELPFKKCDTAPLDFVIPSKKNEVELALQFEYFKEPKSLIITHFITSDLLNKIWQPPKI